MSLWSRLTNVFRGERLTREIDEEHQSHIDDALAEGRKAAEVRHAFGSALLRREESRDLRLIPWLDSLRSDAVFSWRQLMKTKVTSGAAILSLALAIGACTSAFRIIDALLLRPMPVANADRLNVIVFDSPTPAGYTSVYDSCSYPMFEQMRNDVKGRADLIAVSYADRVDLTFKTDEEMEKANRQYVSGSMFGLFGLQAAAGRLINEHDDAVVGKSPVAVLSHDYWVRRFGSDPTVVGRSVRFGDQLFEIAGVSEAKFTGTETGTVTDIFIPIAMKTPSTLASWNNFWMRTFVVLRPGVSAEPVEQRLIATFHSIQEQRLKTFGPTPQLNVEKFRKEKMFMEPAAAGRSNLQRDYKRPLMILGILVVLVLLIACANVANLMTARAAARSREMALRVSIGAGRLRLVQLVMTESAWVALLATALGAVFAWWAAPFILSIINSPDNPARLALPMDWRVLGFALVLALAVTFLFGLTPALRASAVKPASALKGGDNPHSRRRLMHALIALQVTFCFVVQLVAGLFVTTLERLTNQPFGYSAERILNLESVAQRPQTPEVWDQVAEHLRAIPGVEKVSITTWPLMSGESAVDYVSINGAAPTDVFSDFLRVSPGWFDTMKIPLIDGREFRSTDSGPAVAIVNEMFAKQFFDGANPIGKSFDRVDNKGVRTRTEIVGYAHDSRSRDNLRAPIRPTVFLPFTTLAANGTARPAGRGTFVIKVANANPVALASMLRQEVSRSRPEIRVSNIRSQVEINESKSVRERLLAMLALFFAIVALLLAGVGLYGVLDYSVLQRRREIGIRIAIGADAGDIAWRVTAEVFAMVVTGAVLGVGLGVASANYVQALLYHVKATDSGVLGWPMLTIIGAALLASVPAVIRAVRIDPVEMLRSE